MKKRYRILMAMLTCLMLLAMGCSQQESGGSETADSAEEETEIQKVRLIADPPAVAQIIKDNKEIFESKGYELEMIDITDPIGMNQAVEEGSADANFFQHEIYMQQFNENNDGHIVVCGDKLYAQLVGIYSEKIDDLSDLPDGATVAIQNDDTNRDRALKVLEDAGLLTLDPEVPSATTLDIVENPKGLQFSEMVGNNLVEALKDVDIAVIPGYVVAKAGGDPQDNLGIYDRDDKDKYAVLMGVKEGNENEQWAKDLHDFLESPEVKEQIEKELQGSWYPLD